jgi:Ni/Co efflux regulator RcnB
MKKSLIAALALTVLATPVVSAPAEAQRDDSRDYRWHDNDRNWDPANNYRAGDNRRERRLSRNDRIYRGRDGRAYCRRSDGTTGLVIGAVGGGLLANLVGGGTLGTLAGAGGGALLGRSVDRGNVKCR